MEQICLFLLIVAAGGLYFTVRVKQNNDLQMFQKNIAANIVKGGEFNCPNCGSNQLQSDTKGWHWKSGLLGSGQIIITCKNCGDKWEPVFRK